MTRAEEKPQAGVSSKVEPRSGRVSTLGTVRLKKRLVLAQALLEGHGVLAHVPQAVDEGAGHEGLLVVVGLDFDELHRVVGRLLRLAHGLDRRLLQPADLRARRSPTTPTRPW